MGRCLSPCDGSVDSTTYAAVVRQLRDNLLSRPDDVVELITRRMATLADDERFEEAGVHRDRLAAFVLDVILVALVQQMLEWTQRDSTFFLMLLAYHIGFWTWKNTTVGGIICQLRLVRVDGAALGFGDALVRGLSSIFSLAVLGIGCLWILKDPDRQAWHDKIAGTYVVKVPRNWPL